MSNGANIALRVERFYYDGIRRLQEVVEDRAAPGASGDGGASGNPSAYVSGFAGGGGGADEAAIVGAGRSAGGYPGRAVTNARLEREYVWGPGDGLAGVDELFAQYGGVGVGSGTSAADAAGTSEAAGGRAALFWSIQDGGGDVVALCDSGGPLVSTGAQSGSSQPTSLSTGRVVSQYVYGAYGEVLVAEELAAHPTMHVGHKGLFVDRLDEGMTTSGTDPPAARLEPFAVTLSYARNRHYSPSLGRWMQRDPNATGSQTTGRAPAGSSLPIPPSHASMENRRGDGPMLYAYLQASPVAHADPLGLAVEASSGLPPDAVEDYTGVQIGLVHISSLDELAEAGDGLMPVSFLQPLNDLLEGYKHILRTSRLAKDVIQTSAFTQEEMLDDVLSWDSSDDVFLEKTLAGRDAGYTPLRAQAAQSEASVGPTLASGFNRIRRQGVAPERLMRRAFKADYCKRKIARPKGAPSTLQPSRTYDAQMKRSGGVVAAGTYMECKPGTYGPSARVQRQIDVDGHMIRTSNMQIE